MKKTGLVIVVVLLGTWARAGAFSPAVGVKAGLALSNFSFSRDADDGWQNLASARIGAFVNFRLSRNFVLQSEALFGRKGARFKAEYESSEARVRENLDYLEFPLLLKTRFPRANGFSLNLLVGGFAAVKTGGKSFYEYRDETWEEDIKEEIKDIDFGVVFGAELEWKRWACDVRYVMGLADINDHISRTYSVRNQALTVMLSYHF